MRSEYSFNLLYFIDKHPLILALAQHSDIRTRFMLRVTHKPNTIIVRGWKAGIESFLPVQLYAVRRPGA